MQSHHISPLAGKPRTSARIAKDGKPYFRIKARVLTPLRAKASDRLFKVLSALWLLRCIFAFFNFPEPGPFEAGAAAALFVAGEIAFLLVVHSAFCTTTEIVMTPDTVKVRRWLAWRSYNRLLEHHFALGPHERAGQEAREMDFKAREASLQGRVLKEKPYYAESFRLWLSYGGHPVTLLTVYGAQDATAIVARLTYCDRVLNEAIGMTGGINARPEDDWAETPGEIRHG